MGLLLPSLGEIWVNAGEARDWPPRRRFTIGHELGHWCLHRHEGAVVPQERGRPAWRGGRNDQSGGRQAHLPEESEANEFAAAVLMPAELVRRHYERLRRRDPDECFAKLAGCSGRPARR